MNIGYCTKCKNLDVYDENDTKCPSCGGILVDLGVSVETWNNMSNDEMMDAINKASGNAPIKKPQMLSQSEQTSNSSSNLKALKCEMCNSNDLVKKDGMYVCQNCGTKYTVEEAKKLMGVVKIDNTDKLSNLFESARRAFQANNYESARNFYEQILSHDSHSWEATFFSTYCQVAQCKIYQIAASANMLSSCLLGVFQLIGEYGGDKNEKQAAVTQVCSNGLTMFLTLAASSRSHYNETDVSIRSNYTQELLDRLVPCATGCYTMGELIEQLYPDLSKLAVQAWNAGINIQCGYVQFTSNKQGNTEIINKYANRIRKYDPSYKVPSYRTGGGCYVATCVYGSYDCPEVWTLRRFRDYYLGKTWYGRAFIRLYYAVSPTIVRLFGDMNWFRYFWKARLDKLIHKLRSQGVADTEYNDMY